MKLRCIGTVFDEVFILFRMIYHTTLRFQKCLYLNVYLDIVWFLVTAFFLYAKIDKLQHLTKYLSLTVFTLQIAIEIVRLYLGYCGNLSSRVPDLAGFLMLTVLMQLPLVSFFLFNPYLLSTPTEVTLHAILWLMSSVEVVLCYLCLKEASALAKIVYLNHPSNNKSN